MNKAEMTEKARIMKKVGHLHQIVDAVPVTYRDGRADGMSAWQIQNGPLQFTVMKDKCLDIAELSYRGINFSFLSKPGMQGRNHYDTNGEEALRSIMGGMLFTCGLDNICAVCQKDGKEYPMHGRIRTTPAEHAGVSVGWDEDGCTVTVSGEMRQAELFGENLVLRRTITTTYPGREIHIRDVVENQGFRETPMMILYHFNVGYPLLDEGARILLPAVKTIPRDADAAAQPGRWDRMEAPVDGEPEAVFLHELAEDENGIARAAVINEKLGLGICLEFERKNLPYFMQWKSRASGDYVVGLEPANSSVYGRGFHEERGDLHMLGALESETMSLTLRILEGEELDEIQRLTV